MSAIRTRTTNNHVDHLVAARREKLKRDEQREKDEKRKSFESMLMIEASVIVDEKLREGSTAHEVAGMVLAAFPEAVKTNGLSRTKVAQAAVVEALPSEPKYTDKSVKLGLAIASKAIYEAFTRLDRTI